jgi:hypothetical protein
MIRERGKLPNANPTLAPVADAPTALQVLAFRLVRVFDHGLRMSVVEAGDGCDVLVAAGIMPPPTKEQVLALEVKISRVQVVWGLDAEVTPHDCAQAR